MITTKDLQAQLAHTMEHSDLSIGKRVQGKVRDSYLLGDKRLLVTTDRISAFDRVLCTLPFKGRVLNRIAEFWFDHTKHIIDNHKIKVIDDYALLAKECTLIPVEMVVRGYLTGSTTTSVWHHYDNGGRNFCGNILPDGMVKNQVFDKPIITPSSKAEHGHDESLSPQDLIAQGFVSKEIYDQMATVALELFCFGRDLLAKNNLILVDTKYEFGLLNGKLVLIDEIHTPDSSRFWIKDTYQEKFEARTEPDKLDKEYVRLWLASQGFVGEGDIPPIPDEIKVQAAKRYITAYEMITGQEFHAKIGSVTEKLQLSVAKEGLQ